MKFLILEDNDQDAEIVQRLLKKEFPHSQFSLVMTRNDYVKALTDFNADVIVSDHSMPQFSAPEALEILKGRDMAIPFILVTGTVSEEFAASIMKEGADDYILKDRMARLPAAINAALKKKKAERDKKEARSQLAKSEKKYRSLYERNHAGVYQINTAGVILNCNNAFAQMFGYSIEDIQLINAEDLYFSSESRKAFIKLLRKQNQITNHDHILKHKDGSEIHVIENSSLITDADTKEEIIEGVMLDITRQKKADEDLKKFSLEKEALAERMSIILNTLPANIALLDEQGVIIDVNDAWRNFADRNGFTGKNYAIGDNYVKVINASTEQDGMDGKKVAAGIRSVLEKKKQSFEYEYPCHTPEEEMWFRMIVTPLHSRSGVVVMHINITEQKNNELALESTLKVLSDYKKALDESSIVSITDSQGLITYVNNNFCTISKYRIRELLGRDHRILNSSYHDQAFIKKLWNTISKGGIWRDEFRNRAKDGSFYWLDTTIIPFLNNEGKPVQYIAINVDITEQKSIEEELLHRKVQEQKKITRAIITAQEKERNHLSEELHDNINQILAGTKLFLNSAANTNEMVKKLIKYPIELIDNSIEEIRLLCRRLVTPLKNVELYIMVSRLLDNYKNNTSLNIAFEYSLSSHFDNDDLKLNIYRIIQEQMNNITKHADAKMVTIIIEEDNYTIHVIIKDDGKGFNVTKGKKGVGLTNMINRIDSYNGKISIISSPGEGCSVNIQIPK